MPDSTPPEQRFSDRVENYVRYRPSYPPQVFELLGEARVMADVGSGTGLSAEMFVRAGKTVFGIEPNRAMRHAAERLLGFHENFHSIDACAHSTTLPDHSVDLIIAAQAFHWFNTPETRVEFSRILQPEGCIALIWNERKLDATPFLRDYEALLVKYATDYAQVRHENIDPAALDRFFIGPYSTHSFPNEQQFDFEGLRGRLMSSSYAPTEGSVQHERMIAALRQIHDRHQIAGQVRFEYNTVVNLGA